MEPRLVGHRASEIIATNTTRRNIRAIVRFSVVDAIECHSDPMLTAINAAAGDSHRNELDIQIITTKTSFSIRGTAVPHNEHGRIVSSLILQPTQKTDTTLRILLPLAFHARIANPSSVSTGASQTE